MRWRVIAVVAAFCIIISLGVMEVCLADKYISHAENELEKIMDVINEDNFTDFLMKEKVSTLEKYWQKKENTLCFMVIHTDIRDLGATLKLCLASQRSENFEDFKQNLELASFYLESYKHLFTLSAQNIF